MTQEEEFKLQNYRAMENRLMSANSDAYHAQANLEIVEEQLKQRDETIKQLKESLKNLLDFNDKSPYEQSLIHCNDVWALMTKARKLLTE